MSIPQRLKRITDKLGGDRDKDMQLLWPDAEGNIIWKDAAGVEHTEPEYDYCKRLQAEGVKVIHLRWPEESHLTDDELLELHRLHRIQEREFRAQQAGSPVDAP